MTTNRRKSQPKLSGAKPHRSQKKNATNLANDLTRLNVGSGPTPSQDATGPFQFVPCDVTSDDNLNVHLAWNLPRRTSSVARKPASRTSLSKAIVIARTIKKSMEEGLTVNVTFRIDEEGKRLAFLYTRLQQIGQLALKKFCQILIENLCPQRRARHVYKFGKAPAWWPKGAVEFAGPHHMHVDDTTATLLFLLRLHWDTEEFIRQNEGRGIVAKFENGWSAFVEAHMQWRSIEHLYAKKTKDVDQVRQWITEVLQVLRAECDFVQGRTAGDLEFEFKESILLPLPEMITNFPHYFLKDEEHSPPPSLYTCPSPISSLAPSSSVRDGWACDMDDARPLIHDRSSTTSDHSNSTSPKSNDTCFDDVKVESPRHRTSPYGYPLCDSFVDPQNSYSLAYGPSPQEWLAYSAVSYGKQYPMTGTTYAQHGVFTDPAINFSNNEAAATSLHSPGKHRGDAYLCGPSQSESLMGNGCTPYAYSQVPIPPYGPISLPMQPLVPTFGSPYAQPHNDFALYDPNSTNSTYGCATCVYPEQNYVFRAEHACTSGGSPAYCTRPFTGHCSGVGGGAHT